MKFVERATRTERVVSRGLRYNRSSRGLRTLVSEVGSVRLVEVEWQVLDPDDLQEEFGHALDSVREIMRRTKPVYGTVNATFAMIVITMCSLRLNLPGLRLHV